jgi:nitrite reductase (NO-forming)/hydroxylamine reductase
MPAWGSAGVLSPAQVDLMARFLQHPPPQPAEMPIEEMKKHWKVFIAPEKRPTKPEHNLDWQDFTGIVLRDAGKVAIIDGKTKATVAIVDTGFAVHILRSSASGRYFYSIGRDGKATMIDLWMKKPDKVAEVKTCYDARSIDSSKYSGPRGDFKDKLLIIGCYWPPSVVILDGQTLEPKKLISTSGYTYDTNEFLREARVAAIAASHYAPEWVINIKETGYIWIMDYSDLTNLQIRKIAAERFLHDGGFDASQRYILMAANARDSIAAIDLKERKLVSLIKVDKTPHPGRGANILHEKYGPIWCTGHLGAPTIACLGTDPVKFPQYAWKVVGRMTMTGAGGGNLFIKTHPKSRWLYADRTLHPNRDLYRTIYVFDKQSFKLVKTLPLPEKFPGRAVHIEYNREGTETYISAWSPQNQPSALLVYDDATLTLKHTLSPDWMVTPTGKWNVYNTVKDIY